MKKLFWLLTSVMITGCAGGNALNGSNLSNVSIDITQLPAQPELVDSVALEYWEIVNITDTDIERRLSEFYYILDLGTKRQAVVSQAFKQLIQKSNEYPEIRDSINTLVREYLYSTDSPYLDEDMYGVFITETLKHGDVTEAQRVRYESTMDQIDRNRPGTLIPDITVLTKDGLQTISEIAQAKPMIILIYDGGCNDCQKAINTIISHDTLPKMMEEGRIKILAINTGTPTGNTINKAGWIEARAKSDIESNISFRSVPSAYLIDPQGRILIKDHSIQSILGAIGFK